MIPERIRSEMRLDGAIGDLRPRLVEPELQPHLASYLCVLISGYLELSIREILRFHCSKRSAPEVAAFAAASLKSFQNPTREQIEQLLRRFSVTWVESLADLEDGTMDQINSLVLNRHKIAHGEVITLGLRQVLDHYESAKRLIRHLERLSGS